MFYPGTLYTDNRVPSIVSKGPDLRYSSGVSEHDSSSDDDDQYPDDRRHDHLILHAVCRYEHTTDSRDHPNTEPWTYGLRSKDGCAEDPTQ